MPKVSITADNKVDVDNSYPQLKLEYGGRALINAIEPEPTMEYVHTLRAPAVGPDGRVIKEEKLNKNKEKYTANKMEFFGQHLCFGDFDVVSEKGVDPANCPSCQAAVDGDGIEAPKPRYAMHVLTYGLQPGGFQLKEPFNVDLIAWVFAAGRFNSLIELATTWGDLRLHDLKLGPCENKDFQKYEIGVTPHAEWLGGATGKDAEGNLTEEAKKRKEIAGEVYSKNQSPDLSLLIGRRVDKSKAMEDIARVRERIEEAYGRKDNTPSVSDATQSIADDVTSVFSKNESAAEPTQAPEAGPGTAAAAETTTATKEMSFDDIMRGL